MSPRKNKTVRKHKGGENPQSTKSRDFFGKKTFMNMFQKTYDDEQKLADKLKKQDPKISFVSGKDLKPGCRYTFIDSSVYDKEFTVESIKKDDEQGPKTAAGEQYFLTNKGWWVKDFPIGGNDKFILINCNKSGGKKNKSRKNIYSA